MALLSMIKRSASLYRKEGYYDIIWLNVLMGFKLDVYMILTYSLSLL